MTPEYKLEDFPVAGLFSPMMYSSLILFNSGSAKKRKFSVWSTYFTLNNQFDYRIQTTTDFKTYVLY